MIFPTRHRLAAAATALLSGVLPGKAEPIEFRSVEASFQGGSPEELQECIDGIEAGPHGWRVLPRIGEEHSAIFHAAAPLNADVLQLRLCFLSGLINSAAAEFAISATTEARPALHGRWEPLRIVRFRADQTKLAMTGGHRLRAKEDWEWPGGKRAEDVYTIVVRTERRGITGFRLDVFPVVRKTALPEELQRFYPAGPVVSWGIHGDFVLTEFRAEPLGNVALGAPAKASHALYPELEAEALTDGLPSTFAHPEEPYLGAAFDFTIDLGRTVAMDHLSLRGRNDNVETADRLSRLLVQLYDRAPADGVRPVWQALHRADGSYPKDGQPDIVRATKGEGEFRGRYLRLSSDSPVPHSPQLAEVEAYETRVPELVALRADGRGLPTAGAATVPAGSAQLAFECKIPQPGRSPKGALRWRIEGLGADWQVAPTLSMVIPCPRPGSYVLQAQAGHQDGIWDAGVLSLPMTVLQPFTETPAFRWLAATGALVAGAFLVLLFTRRNIAALKTQSALAEERTRIARDMHDEVGARLSQLVMLQDVFAREHALPETAREDLRQLGLTAQQAVTSLDEVVWTVNPQNDTLASLAEFLAHYASGYLEPAHIACRILAPIDWPAMEVRAQVRHELVCAFKEALQNVVKHAHAREVAITLTLASGSFSVTVADDGCGLPEMPGGPEKDGLANMKSRLASVGGTCEFFPRPTGGTEVTLRVPLPR